MSPARRGAVAGLALWLAAVLAVQRWVPWADAIRGGIRGDTGFGSDMRFYELIARASPSFPDEHVLRPYAERFPVHWLVGGLAAATDAGLHPLYRLAELLCLALVLMVLHAALARLDLEPSPHLLALGVFAASAYPVHYLLAAPGMLSDGVFLLGFSLCLLGFVRGWLALVVGGLVVAVLGRQTGVPVALAAALWAFFAPAWRNVRWWAAAATGFVPLGLWLVLHFASSSFASPERGGIQDLTAVGFLSDLGDVSGHLGRVLLGVLVPSALVAGAWMRTRGDVPRGALLLAAVVVVQPLVLGPASTGGNETRLAALALPALALAAGALLRGTRLRTWETAVIALALFAAGLHHRYTHLGLDRAAWLTFEIAGAAVILGVLARPAAAGIVAARGRPA